MLLYGALCRGLLSGKLDINSEFQGDDLRNSDPEFKNHNFKKYLSAVDNLNKFAHESYGKNVLQLSVRWILDNCENDIALWGARKPEQLSEVDEVTSWSLNKESLEKIDVIIENIIKDTIGPEFMAPGSRSEI